MRDGTSEMGAGRTVPAMVVRVEGVVGVGAALAVAHRHSVVIAFEPTWGDVDRARVLVAAAGLAGRVHVHHADAMRWLPEPARPLLRSA